MNNFNLQIPVIIFGWFVLFLIIYNIHRYTKFLSRKPFYLALVGSLFLLFFVLIFNRSRENFPPIPHRIFVCPGYEKLESAQVVTARGLSIADQIINRINSAKSQLSFAVPSDWILRHLNADSLSSINYVNRQSRLFRAEYTLLTTLRKSPGGNSSHFLLFHWTKNAPLSTLASQPVHGNTVSTVRRIVSDLAALMGISLPQTDRPTSHSLSYWQKRMGPWCDTGAASTDSMNEAYLALTPDDSLELAAREVMFDNTLAQVPLEKRRQQLHRLRQALLDRTKNDSLHIEFNLLAARCLLWCEEFDRIESRIKRLVRQQPQRAEAYQMLSQLHFTRYQTLGFANEVELLTTALRLDPLDLEIVCQLAGVYMQTDKLDRSVNLLEKYRRHMPDNFLLLKALGQAYIKQGKTLEIFEIYNKILEIDPQNSEAFYNLGIHYFYNGENSIAKRIFRQALRVNPQVDSYLYLAHIAEKEDSLEVAIQYLQKRLKNRQSRNDQYAEEARRRLFRLNLRMGTIDSSGRVLQTKH